MNGTHMKSFVKTVICGFCVLTVLSSLFGCAGILLVPLDDEDKSDISDQAMEIASSLLQAIEDEDSEAFRELFADHVAEQSDFANGEEYTFEIYTGTMQSIEQHIGETGGRYGNGSYKFVSVYYTIATNECEYKMMLEYYTKHATDQGKIRTLKILKTEDMPETGAYADMTAGGWVYYPDHPYQHQHD